MSQQQDQRQSTQAIQQVFGQAGITNTELLHSTCPITLDDVNPNNIIILGPCGHTFSEENIKEHFEINGHNCPICRSAVINTTSINNGTETIFNFLSRLTPPPPPPLESPPQQFFCARQNSCGGGGSGGYNDNNNNNRSLKHMILLPCFPVREQISLDNADTNLLALTSVPENGLSVFTMIATTSSVDSNDSNTDIFGILDISGSMSGTKLNKSKEAIISLIHNLNPSQRFCISAFDDYVEHIFPLQHITSLNRDQIIALVQGIYAVGGTEYTDSFKFAKTLFDQADSPNRKKIVLFFSDGEPSSTPNLNVIDELFIAHPTLILYPISMGNGVNAAQQMVPLLRNRSPELGCYIDCPDMAQFSSTLERVVGNIASLYATNITVRFVNAEPITSLAQRNEDGSFSVHLPILNVGEALNIALRTTGDNLPQISYSLTRDGVVSESVATVDTEGVLPDEISKHFPRSKIIKERMNEIITNQTTSSNEKQVLLRSLLAEINEEMHGNYFIEMKQTMESIILSLDPANRNNMQMQNTATSATQSVRQNTSSRTASASLSANIRSNSAQVSPLIPLTSLVSPLSLPLPSETIVEENEADENDPENA
jgi:hypothetical protein